MLASFKNRLLQILARFSPGAKTWRVRFHRWRGVKIGNDVFIGYDAIIETEHPQLVTIKDGVDIGMRSTIIAHMRESRNVTIEEDVILGPGTIVLPNVTIGRGAVVTAGSVVTTSIPAMTLVQGNPARPIARIGKMLTPEVSLKEFAKHLKPLR